ncbi:MAG: DUF599 domain-containing protein [Rhodobacteraceae bacterium]|nr:DUF599 domain-containing protein [Paracoccaceae bacterium]
MDIAKLLSTLPVADWSAFALLIGGWLMIGHFTENPPKGYPSVSWLMQGYRRDWMVQFVTRNPRIFDATVLDSLRQGTSFFASACMIAIGGGVAFIASPDQLEGLTGGLPFLASAPALVQIKFLLIVLFLTNAMLKFVWSHRLFGYCAILMAAVPNDGDDPQAMLRARQAAEINILAARNFNKGLRSVYFALGTLGWLLGPYGLIASASATIFVSWRREFASRSRQVLLSGPDHFA